MRGIVGNFRLKMSGGEGMVRCGMLIGLLSRARNRASANARRLAA